MTLLGTTPGRSFTLHIRKGNDGDNPVIAWSAIMDCLKDRCRIYDLCSYGKKGKCEVQVQFLQVTMEMIERENPQLKYHQAYRIGLHLLPLYKMLCKLYMDELAVCHPTYTTDKGTRQSHPVYKEIRDTIKMIMIVWKDIGLSGSAAGTAAGLQPINLPDSKGYTRGMMRAGK